MAESTKDKYPERHVKLEKAYNFRDLGYYPAAGGGRTRPGLIFRADTLSRLSAADKEIVQGLGIKSVFDMRREDEQQHEGSDAFAPPVSVYHVPTGLDSSGFLSYVASIGEEFTMLNLYLRSFDERAGYHADLFRRLANSDALPAVFHCSAGKDRTGIMAALILDLAGVSEEIIVGDYVETAENMREEFVRQRERFEHSGSGAKIFDELYSSHARTMEGLLEYLRSRYGTAADYLQAGGVTVQELEGFRAMFIERS